MMRLTGQKIFDATQVLAKIINDNRPLPVKGTYRVNRMHARLFEEFTTLNTQRTAKIASYDYLAPVLNGVVLPPGVGNPEDPNITMQPAVPPDKMPEFVEWWKELASVETDVNIEPIPIDQLCLGADAASTITFAEFSALGELVSE